MKCPAHVINNLPLISHWQALIQLVTGQWSVQEMVKGHITDWGGFYTNLLILFIHIRTFYALIPNTDKKINESVLIKYTLIREKKKIDRT